jgi:hypothetical protein
VSADPRPIWVPPRTSRLPSGKRAFLHAPIVPLDHRLDALPPHQALGRFPWLALFLRRLRRLRPFLLMAPPTDRNIRTSSHGAGSDVDTCLPYKGCFEKSVDLNIDTCPGARNSSEWHQRMRRTTMTACNWLVTTCSAWHFGGSGSRSVPREPPSLTEMATRARIDCIAETPA